jgi:hypothetical protein
MWCWRASVHAVVGATTVASGARLARRGMPGETAVGSRRRDCLSVGAHGSSAQGKPETSCCKGAHHPTVPGALP